MNKDIHDKEDFFRGRLDPNFEEPSEEVWDKINARLDKELADTYKRKFFALKRVSMLLLLGLLSFILFMAIFVNRSFTRQPAGAGTDQKISSNNFAGKSKSPKYNNSRSDRTGAAMQSLPGDTSATGSDTETYSLNNQADSAGSRSADKEAKKGLLKSLTAGGNVLHDIVKSTKSLDNSKQEKYVTNLQNHSLSKQPWKLQEKENAAANTPVPPAPPALLADRLITSNITSSISVHTKPLIVVKDIKMETNHVANSTSVIKLTKFHPSWSFTAFASHEWTNYNLEDDEREHQNPPQRDDKSEIKHREEHEPAYTLGVLATYQFKKRLAIQTGITFENSSISIHPQTLTAFNDATGQVTYKYNISSGYVFVNPSFSRNPVAGDKLTALKGQNNLKYISIPFIIKYRKEFGKITVSPGVGFTTNFLAGASIETEIEDGARKEEVNLTQIKGIRSFYIGITSNASINYKITRSFGISVMPSFNYALIPITSKNVVKTYPFSVGGGIGLIYRP